MPVHVRMADGTDQTFPTADSAHRHGPLIIVSRWDAGRLHEIAVFDARDVSLAEVVVTGALANIVLGAGRRRPEARNRL